MKLKIGIVTCWYGPYPWYFPYFIHSCSYNHTIDFIIITNNQHLIPNKPKNVKIINKKLEEIKIIASEKLGFKINIDYPYKLCDFKPAYGFIFQNIITGYDFWGHSDLDVIYGDIREFLNYEMLILYDFISLRHEYTTGVFSLYRNNEKMNTFFMRSKDYKLVFTNAQHYSFGECNFARNEVVAGKSIFDLETEIESFTHLMKAAEITNEIKVHFDFILMEGTTGRLMFCDGKIIYKKQFDAILYHLYWLKKIYSPQKVPKKIPNVYYISPTRIYHYRKNKIEYDEK
jgi:hypothetical protein